MGCEELVACKKGEAKEEEEGAGRNRGTIKCSPVVRGPQCAWCCVVVGAVKEALGSVPAPFQHQDQVLVRKHCLL